MKDYVVIRIRIELPRGFYERAKALGYKLDDMREAIAQAGMSELSELISEHEERADDSYRRNL